MEAFPLILLKRIPLSVVSGRGCCAHIASHIMPHTLLFSLKGFLGEDWLVLPLLAHLSIQTSRQDEPKQANPPPKKPNKAEHFLVSLSSQFTPIQSKVRQTRLLFQSTLRVLSDLIKSNILFPPSLSPTKSPSHFCLEAREWELGKRNKTRILRQFQFSKSFLTTRHPCQQGTPHIWRSLEFHPVFLTLLTLLSKEHDKMQRWQKDLNSKPSQTWHPKRLSWQFKQEVHSSSYSFPPSAIKLREKKNSKTHSLFPPKAVLV